MDYKDNDDLELYDSVIEQLSINHRNRTVEFKILKVISRLNREGGFTYKVRPGNLKFEGVVFSNIQYGLYWDTWSEFYRSALLSDSELLDRARIFSLEDGLKEKLRHIYLGIDNGADFKKVDIVCSQYSLDLQPEEYILHDDFEWLYEG